MDAVRDAVGLLTRVPLAVVGDRPGAAAFGLVGAAIGAAGAVALMVLAGAAAESWLGAVAAVATTALVTGALHLDGLADTTDALLAPDPAAAERARKDPALGSGGVTAVVLAIGTEVVALSSLAGSDGVLTAAATFVAVSTVGRVVPVVATRSFPRPDGAVDDRGGQGAWFAAAISTRDTVLAVGTAIAVVGGLGLLLGPSAAPPLVVAAVVCAGIGLITAMALGAVRHGFDGDAMGATIEVAVLAGLAAGALVA